MERTWTRGLLAAVAGAIAFGTGCAALGGGTGAVAGILALVVVWSLLGTGTAACCGENDNCACLSPTVDYSRRDDAARDDGEADDGEGDDGGVEDVAADGMDMPDEATDGDPDGGPESDSAADAVGDVEDDGPRVCLEPPWDGGVDTAEPDTPVDVAAAPGRRARERLYGAGVLSAAQVRRLRRLQGRA